VFNWDNVELISGSFWDIDQVFPVYALAILQSSIQLGEQPEPSLERHQREESVHASNFSRHPHVSLHFTSRKSREKRSADGYACTGSILGYGSFWYVNVNIDLFKYLAAYVEL